MSYLDRYNWRLKVDGENLGDSLRNNTHHMKNKKFKDAMTYRLANYYINKGTEKQISGQKDIRVIEIDRQGSIRNILFRVGESLKVGNILEFDDELWLAYDLYGSTVDDIKLRVSRMNDTLKWRDRKGEIHKIPCITSTNTLGSGANSNDGGYLDNAYNVHMPDGKILIFAELNDDTKKIELKQRFIVGSKVYQVVYIDDVTLVDKNYYGVLKFILEVDITYNDKDDFERSLAYNDLFELQESSFEKKENEVEEEWGW